LQDRVLDLFTGALRHGGYLWLGTKESLMFSAVAPLYEAVDSRQKIYRKKA
jgi:chemotaxis protein methyltransferase CheR